MLYSLFKSGMLRKIINISSNEQLHRPGGPALPIEPGAPGGPRFPGGPCADDAIDPWHNSSAPRRKYEQTSFDWPELITK